MQAADWKCPRHAALSAALLQSFLQALLHRAAEFGIHAKLHCKRQLAQHAQYKPGCSQLLLGSQRSL
jgi:hypothetical protein